MSDRSPGIQRLTFLLTAGGICAAGLVAIVLTGSYFNNKISSDTFLVFLLIAELATVVVSFSIFITGWYGNKQEPNSRILAISVTFFGVGILDFIHALSYNGMPPFLSENSLDKASVFWIAARLIAATGLLLVAFIPETKTPRWLFPRLLLLAMAGFVIGLVLMENYAPGLIPPLFTAGQGATPLKITLEYIVIGLNLAAIVALWRRHVFGFSATVYLQTALVISIFGELALTFYTSAYDSYNVIGHIYKLAAYYLILRSVFVASMQQPYRELNRAREDLEHSFGRIGTALASSLELNKTLELIASLAAEMLHTPYALVALQGNKEDALSVMATLGISDPPAEIPLENSLAAKVIEDRQPVFIYDMADREAPFPSRLTGRELRAAVAAPILRNNAVLGVLAVYSGQAGAYDESQARLLAAFARQAAVAIGNARLFKSELDARAKITSYASRLSILHQIGLSLNRETNQRKLLDTVLKGAADLTEAGVGILLLIKEDATEIASVYYPAWNPGSCQVSDDPAAIHRGVDRIIEAAGDPDVVRLSDLSGLRPLPAGHVTLEGLMIATIRDIRGNPRGHFMLTAKRSGAVFTSEDEEVISLLAAQCSVALTSAENFEREHYVAETLQTALLPQKPVREDIEVGLLYRSAAPYAKVGGDYYDFIELDDHRLAVAVGDVCGKGLEAATYTAMIKYMLRAYIGEGMFPGDCLTRLNRNVYEEVSAEKFITMSLAVIDTKQGFINFSAAGHPPPLICRDGKAHTLTTPQSVPLGVLSDFTYLSSQIRLDGACALFMYTDGLIEARPPEEEPFGVRRVIDAVAGRCCLNAQKVAEDLMQKAVEYSGGNLRDDIALLVVRLLQPKLIS